MAVRKAPEIEAERYQPLWMEKSQSRPDSMSFETGKLSADPFASFMALRSSRTSLAPQSMTEQSLREDLLRTKRQLLEVGLKAELKALDPSCPPETAARLRRVRRAQRYLHHPEQTLEALSGGGSEASDQEVETPDPRQPSIGSRHGGVMSTSASAPSLGSAAHGQHQHQHGQRSLGAGVQRATGDTISLPPLVAGAGRAATAATAAAPASATGASAAVACHPQAVTATGAAEKTPLLQRWWTRSKSWNVCFSNKELSARRHNLSISGGTVVLGNGRLPLYTGCHLLSSGFGYSFQVDGVDDKHFPMETCRDLSCGFGISRYPPQHKHCERPVFAYEIPGSILVGYGDHLIDRGEWRRAGGWNARELRRGDVVSILIPPDGDIVVFVNGEQVLRAGTSLGEEGDFSQVRSAQKRTLYPVVDLHGRICAASLLPSQAPPNKPLQPRGGRRS